MADHAPSRYQHALSSSNPASPSGFSAPESGHTLPSRPWLFAFSPMPQQSTAEARADTHSSYSTESDSHQATSSLRGATGRPSELLR